MVEITTMKIDKQLSFKIKEISKYRNRGESMRAIVNVLADEYLSNNKDILNIGDKYEC